MVSILLTMLLHAKLPKVLNMYQLIHFHLILSMSLMNCVLLLPLFSRGGNLDTERESHSPRGPEFTNGRSWIQPLVCLVPELRHCAKIRCMLGEYRNRILTDRDTSPQVWFRKRPFDLSCLCGQRSGLGAEA